MEEIIQYLFLLQEAPKFMSIAGFSWGIDLVSTGVLVNLFTLILFVLILIKLSFVFGKLNTKIKKIFVVFFVSFVLGAISKTIDFVINMLSVVFGEVLWSSSVGVIVGLFELTSVMGIIIGFSVILYVYHARFSNSK